MIYRPADSDFDTVHLGGAHPGKMTFKRFVFIFVASLCVGIVISGLASAVRNFAARHDSN